MKLPLVLKGGFGGKTELEQSAVTRSPRINTLLSARVFSRLLDLSGQFYFSGPFQCEPLPDLSSLVSSRPPWALASLNYLTLHTSFFAFI